MGLLSFLTPMASEKVIEKATDGIYNGLDKLFETSEEKSDARQKALDTILQFHKVYAAENSRQALTRCYLALGIAGYYLGILTMGLAAKLWLDGETHNYIMEIAKLLSWPFLSVITTYFVPHQLAKLRK